MSNKRSEWQAAKDGMNGFSLTMGQHVSHWLYRSPRRLLHSMSYYKFAAKMIGKSKRVLDIGCGEGIGTYLLAKECGHAMGLDFDETAIETATRNFGCDTCSFSCADFLAEPTSGYDAVVNFDVIEHILPEHADDFISGMAASLSSVGIAVIGTPSEISQQFASEVAKAGHINIYDVERLEFELSRHFKHVIIFSANDELVHTGYTKLAHYYLALACCPRRAPGV